MNEQNTKVCLVCNTEAEIIITFPSDGYFRHLEIAGFCQICMSKIAKAYEKFGEQ